LAFVLIIIPLILSSLHFIFFDENNPFIKKLNLEESEALEGDLKPDEMLVALKSMKNGKSPGLDGFTTEFYYFFWSDLKYFAVRSVIYQSCTLTNETSFHETHLGIRDKIC
jgi:hypothetical protein